MSKLGKYPGKGEEAVDSFLEEEKAQLLRPSPNINPQYLLPFLYPAEKKIVFVMAKQI